MTQAFAGDQLSFSIDNLPPGLMLDEATGVLSGVPTVSVFDLRRQVVARNAFGEATVELAFTFLPAAAETWSPSLIPGMHWWNASDPASRAQDAAGVVTSIAAQSTGGPALIGNGVARWDDAAQGVRFGGSVRPLVASLPSAVGGPNRLTMWAVIRPAPGDTDQAHMELADGVNPAFDNRRVFVRGDRVVVGTLSTEVRDYLQGRTAGAATVLWTLTYDPTDPTNTARNWTFRGRGGAIAQTYSSASFSGTSAGTSVCFGSLQVGSSLGDGAFVAGGLCSGVLDPDTIRRIEGWAAHSLSGLSPEADLAADHPYRVTPPSAPPPRIVLAAGALAATVGSQVIYGLGQHAEGASSFRVAAGHSLPAGLRIDGMGLVGAPTEARASIDVVIEAVNGSGASSFTLTLSVAEVPAAATTDADVLAMADAAAIGAPIVLDGSWIAARSGELLRLAALGGQNRSVSLIGFTDFKRNAAAAQIAGVAPTMPADLDWDQDVAVPHTDHAGRRIGVTNGHRMTHPQLSGVRWYYFFGPENQVGYDGAPFDFEPTGGQMLPLGLKIRDDATSAEGARAGMVNGLRHRGADDYDGHVLWVAECRMSDGSIRTFVEERDSKARNLPFSPRAEMLDGSLPNGAVATHLRRLATLHVRPWAVDNAAADPIRWAPPPRLARHAQRAADIEVGTVAALQAALETVPAGAGDYIIQLQPGYYEMPRFPLSGGSNNASRAFRFSDAAIVRSIEAGRKIIIRGVPGRTVFNALNFSNLAVAHPSGAMGLRNIEMQWITVAPAKARFDGAGDSDGALITLDAFPVVEVGRDSHVVMRGCVVDGLDSRWHRLFYLGRGNGGAGTHPGCRLTFVDGYIGGAKMGFDVNDTPHVSGKACERLVIARSIIDVANDLLQANGGVSALFEGNRMIGGGGFKKVADRQHPDAGWQGQTQGAAWGNLFAVAYRDNLIDRGRAAGGPTSPTSQGAQYLIMDYVAYDALDWVGNVHTQEPLNGEHNRGWGFIPLRKRAHHPGRGNPSVGGTYESYVGLGVIAGNIQVPLMHRMSPGDAWGQEAWGTYIPGGSGDVRDGATGAENVLQAWPTLVRMPMLFDRQVIWLDAWRTGANAVFPSAADAFEGPVTFTAPSGDWTQGIRADWSRTAFAGTGREGWLSWRDIAAREALARRAPGAARSNFRTLTDVVAGLASGALTDIPPPGQMHRLLGWTQPDGAAYPGYAWLDDLFSVWTPPALDLAARAPIAAPWRPEADDCKMLVNFRIDTLTGPGRLLRETAADGAYWDLSVVDAGGGDLRLQFSIVGPTATGAATRYRVTSNKPLEARQHVAFQVWSRFEDINHEDGWAGALARRFIQAHRAQEATSVRRITFTSAAVAPAPRAPVPGETIAWFDTANSNRPMVWDGAAWREAQGDVQTYLCYLALQVTTDAKVNGRVNGITAPRLEHISLPEGYTRAHYFVSDVSVLAARGVVPQAGDLLRTGPGRSCQVWSGAAWGATANNTHKFRPWRGEVQCWFVQNIEAPSYTPDWIIDNGGTQNVPLPRGTLAFGGVQGTVNYLEARRGDLGGNEADNDPVWRREAFVSPLALALRRAPDDPATGRRFVREGVTPWPQADVWLVA